VKSFYVFALFASGLSQMSTRVLSAATLPVVLEDVLVIDGTGAKPKPHQSIVIEDGKIARIVAAPRVADPPAGAQVIHLSGQTVMPGIINGHGHLGLTKGAQGSADDFTVENIASQLSQYERYGITTIMSLGVNRDLLYQVREEQEKGRSAAPPS
jgi:imidazolonepropionase-like amidohydrolase